MGRHPEGGELELARLRLQDGASELGCRGTALVTADGLEASLYKRLAQAHADLGGVIADVLRHDAWENQQHNAVSQLGLAVSRACDEYREAMQRAQDGDLRGLMQRCLAEMDRLAASTQAGLKTAA